MKKAIVIIVAIIAIILIVAAFLPSEVRVERAISINAPIEVVFDQVVDLEKYLSWSPWSVKDPEMKIEWGDIRSGQGAGYSWKGNDQVGEGTMLVESVVENEEIMNKLDFGMMGGYGIWKFEPGNGENGENAVEVHWIMESGLDRPIPLIGRYFGIFMDFDAMVGADFEQGLSNLKAVAEAIPVKPEIAVEEASVMDVFMLSVTDSVQISDLSAKLGEMYGEIISLMNGNEMEVKSHPLCVYHLWNEEEGYCLIEAGIPILAGTKVKLSGRVRQSVIKGGNVAKVVHTGPYEDLNAAHFAIDKWVAENGKQVSGSPWEVYITDPDSEPDPANWITEVYYPVQ